MKMDIQAELEGIHLNLIAVDQYYITASQVGALTALINMALENPTRENRIKILRLIAGEAMRIHRGDEYEINSTKDIHGGIASFLIDQFLEPQSRPWRLSSFGRDFLVGCETLIKEQA